MDALSRAATLPKLNLCPSEKGSTITEKNKPLGGRLFPIRVDFLLKGLDVRGNKHEVPKVDYPAQNGGTSANCIKSHNMKLPYDITLRNYAYSKIFKILSFEIK